MPERIFVCNSSFTLKDFCLNDKISSSTGHFPNVTCVAPCLFHAWRNNFIHHLATSGGDGRHMSEKMFARPARRRTPTKLIEVRSFFYVDSVPLLWAMKSPQGGIVDYLWTLHNNTTGEYAWTTQCPSARQKKTLIQSLAPLYRPLLTRSHSHSVSVSVTGWLGYCFCLISSVSVSAQWVVVGHVNLADQLVQNELRIQYKAWQTVIFLSLTVICPRINITRVCHHYEVMGTGV